MSGSGDAVLNKVLTMARLTNDGIDALCKDRLTISVTLCKKKKDIL